MTAMLSDQEINSVQDILMTELALQRDQITPEADIQNDLGADSIEMVNIVMNLEERFAIVIPDEVSERIRKVEDIYDELAKRLGRPE
jgi:acyl carrier protein